jgi:hypothetical protein
VADGRDGAQFAEDFGRNFLVHVNDADGFVRILHAAESEVARLGYTERARKSLNPFCYGKLYFFSPNLPISFACSSRAISVRGGSPAFSIDLKTA